MGARPRAELRAEPDATGPRRCRLRRNAFKAVWSEATRINASRNFPAASYAAMPVLIAALRKTHPDMSAEQIENSLTLEDFNALFSAVLEVSGLKKASAGEATPVLV